VEARAGVESNFSLEFFGHRNSIFHILPVEVKYHFMEVYLTQQTVDTEERR
jgi:hypothetical protein